MRIELGGVKDFVIDYARVLTGGRIRESETSSNIDDLKKTAAGKDVGVNTLVRAGDKMKWSPRIRLEGNDVSVPEPLRDAAITEARKELEKITPGK